PRDSGDDSLNTGDVLLAAIPPPVVPVPEVGRTNVIGNFPYKRSVLPASARYMLDSLAEVLRRAPGTILEIDGYTDGIGGDAYNIKLGQRRVDVCVHYLLQKGVDARRLR